MYDVERKQAAKILNVTVRTIDRYIRRQKLSARQINGRVWLARQELLALKRGHPVVTSSLEIHQDAPAPSRILQHKNDEGFYKDLHETTLRLLNEKEQQLHMANYRIGQLEGQQHSPSPFTVQPISLEPPRESSLNELMKKIERDKLNHRIINTLFYIILLLQPFLWYFLRRY